jgi:hypothetical protein
MPNARRPLRSRKLLVASIGVATVSQIACMRIDDPVSGNLMAPPGQDGGAISPFFPADAAVRDGRGDTDATTSDADDGDVNSGGDAGDAGDADAGAD